MHYTIYADAFFFINYVMDYLVLGLTAALMGLKKSRKIITKKLLASLVGASWSIVVITVCHRFILTSILTYFIIGPVLCFLVVGRIRLKRYILSVLCMYIVSFLFAGIVFAIMNYTGVGYVLFHSNFFIVVAIAVPIIEGALMALVEDGRGSELYEVSLLFGTKELRLTALCDSGNALYDPIMCGYVNVINKKALLRECAVEELAKVHLIPFNSVGKEKGMIPVVQMDEMVITEKGKQIIIEKPLVAISPAEFAGGRYELILHPQLLRGRGKE